VMAAVVGKPGEVPHPAHIAAFCETRLQKFAIPRFIDIVAELPRTENGKVQKYVLRERGIPRSGCSAAAACPNGCQTVLRRATSYRETEVRCPGVSPAGIAFRVSSPRL